MVDVVGKNTPAGKELMEYVERLERIDAQKKALSDDRKLVMQEAKNKGYVTAGLTYLIKVRKMKPHDREDAESVRDVYLHAAGMANEPPLFRQIEALARDTAGGEKLLESFKLLVPLNGEIIVNLDGKRVRLWRDKDGNARSADYTPPEPGQSRTQTQVPAPVQRDVPVCSADEAEQLGRAAYKANESIISNPFPHNDPRRPRWDRGWRLESGSDGMGEDD